jgi:hypothetical protein
MGMIARKSLPKEVLTRYDERISTGVEASLALFRSALIPLFSHKGKRPEIIGTGVGVTAGNSRLIFTAAHVIRDFNDDTIFVPLDGGWKTLTGTAHKCETPGWKEPEDDRLDAAILELDDESRRNWSGWIGPELLQPGAPATSSDRYVLAGFPRSKLKYNFKRGSVAPRAVPIFSAPIAEEEYSGSHAFPNVHVVVGFNREKAVQASRIVTAPSFRGMSGGMMLRSPGIINATLVHQTRLAAIFIEWPSPQRVLIATRVDVHLMMLHAQLPMLSSFFPQPVMVRQPQGHATS